MIKYLQYHKEYDVQIKKLVKNIMTEELEIDRKKISDFTKDLNNINDTYIKSGG